LDDTEGLFRGYLLNRCILDRILHFVFAWQYILDSYDLIIFKNRLRKQGRQYPIVRRGWLDCKNGNHVHGHPINF
jgi:hypothetical protein